MEKPKELRGVSYNILLHQILIIYSEKNENTTQYAEEPFKKHHNFSYHQNNGRASASNSRKAHKAQEES